MTGYIEDNLTKGESIKQIADVHWFHFVLPGLSLVVGVVLSLGSAPIGILPIIYGVSGLVNAYFFQIGTELAITSKRVIAKFGFIRRETVELNHKNVESLRVDQGVFGRIFNFGTILINGTGGVTTPIRNIANPLEFRRLALDIIEAE